jgi:AcrR family transcriptional regulator
MVATERKTAEERRVEIVDAAFAEFAERGLHGASTDAIARRAGVSQPYVFRLFGTKKELYLATVEWCLSQTLETFQAAAKGRHGHEALAAIGTAYVELLEDRTRLQAQMQAYAACDDPEVCEVVRRGYGRLFEYVEQVSGASPEEVSAFFAKGMLINVVAAMKLDDATAPWAKRLLEGCRALR